MISPLIIRTCSHTLPEGRRCRGAAVRGRYCCRHHLDARTRLHNMARARRLTCQPRLRVPESPRDLALNRAEANRVLSTQRIDPDAALMMLWALDLTSATFRAPTALPRFASNLNEIYHVPVSPLLEQTCPQILSEMLENTGMGGEGYTMLAPIAVCQTGKSEQHPQLVWRTGPIKEDADE